MIPKKGCHANMVWQPKILTGQCTRGLIIILRNLLTTVSKFSIMFTNRKKTFLVKFFCPVSMGDISGATGISDSGVISHISQE